MIESLIILGKTESIKDGLGKHVAKNIRLRLLEMQASSISKLRKKHTFCLLNQKNDMINIY